MKIIIIREFKIGVNQQVAAFIVVVDALVSDQLISDNILRPHMIVPPDISISSIFRYTKESSVSLNEVKEVNTVEDVVNSIVNGNAVLFIDGFDNAFHRNYPKQWKELEEKWDEEFGKIQVKQEVDVKIRRIGLITSYGEEEE